MQLSNLINGTSETKAVTEKAIKLLNDIVSTKQRGTIGIPVGGNLDNYTETGPYTGYSFVNGAVDGISAFDVFNYSNDWIVQVQYVMGAIPQTFTRSRYNGTTWAPWTRLLDNSRINVPDGIAGLDGSGKIYEAFMPTSAAKIVNVNYVGDGTQGRFIDCGFVPKFAFVETQTSSKKFLIGLSGTTSFNGTSISTWGSKISGTGISLVGGANGPNDAGYNHILTCFG